MSAQPVTFSPDYRSYSSMDVTMQRPLPQANTGPAATEEDLVRAARAGDANAFADLYERHLDAIYRYFYYRLGHHEDAEDLTEQVFLKAWQALPGFRERGVPFLAWLYRVAHNLLIDHRRTARPAADVDQLAPRLPHPRDAGDLVASRDEVGALVQAIAQLSPVEQSVVVLRFVERLDHHTVAGIVGKSETATRAIQSRALQRLARLLDGKGYSRE